MLSEGIMQKVSLYFHEIVLVDTLLMIKMKRMYFSSIKHILFVNAALRQDKRSY